MKPTWTAEAVDVPVATWVKNVKQRMIAKIAIVAPVSARVRAPTNFDDSPLLRIDLVPLFC